MKFIKNSEGKIVRRIITDRAYIENMALYVDGKIFGKIGGTFSLDEAIKTGRLYN